MSIFLLMSRWQDDQFAYPEILWSFFRPQNSSEVKTSFLRELIEDICMMQQVCNHIYK